MDWNTYTPHSKGMHRYGRGVHATHLECMLVPNFDLHMLPVPLGTTSRDSSIITARGEWVHDQWIMILGRNATGVSLESCTMHG